MKIHHFKLKILIKPRFEYAGFHRIQHKIGANIKNREMQLSIDKNVDRY